MVSPAPTGTNPAKQSQFGRRHQTGQVLLAKGVVVNCTCIGPWQNKANSRRCRAGRGPGDQGRGVVQTKPIPKGDGSPQGVGWAHCAKQSQFAINRRAQPSPRPEALTLPPLRGTSAQNKANLTRRQVRTSAGKVGGRLPPGRIVRHRLDAPLRETKPICAEVSDRASPVGERSYDYLYIHRGTAKQSQFLAVPSGTGPGGREPCGVVQTKPIPGGAGWNGARGAWDEGQMRQTNPMCPAGPGGPPSPSRPSGLARATPIVRNKPNLPRLFTAEVPVTMARAKIL
jgi:hypothetical protein